MVLRFRLEPLGRAQAGAVDNLLQPVHQTWGKPKEFVAMEYGQAAQGGAALVRKSDQHPPPVGWITMSFDKTVRLHAVNQADGALVTDLQPIRQVGDPGAGVRSQAAQHEQQLVVLWLEAGGLSRPLAKSEISPNELPGLGEVGVVLIAQIRRLPST